MIASLKRKFITYAMLSIFGLLALTLSAINTANFAMVAKEADEVTAIIQKEGGDFTPPEEGGGPGNPPQNTDQNHPFGPHSPETSETSRFFTVAFKNEETEVVAYHVARYSKEECLEWASLLRGKEGTGWSRTYYRYRVYTENDGTYVTVLDQSRELSPSYRVLNGSIIGSVGGLLLSFMILLFVGKRFVYPIEEANRKQKRFISDASHELKTPLTIISANNEIEEIEKGESDATKAISKQVGRLSHMVKNLNDLAKLDEEKEIHPTSFDLSASIEEIASPFIEAFVAQGKSLSLSLEPGISYAGDQEKIGKLVSLLLDNALKYSNSDAILSLKKENQRIILEEHNDAPNIAEGPLDRIFERFYRSDEARASSVEGSGIGLALAKEIVLAHKGRISAYGEKGRFFIKIEL